MSSIMYNHETVTMEKWKVNQFEMFINNRIGVDFEVTKTGDDSYYIFIMEMTRSELQMVRDYESSILKC